MTKGIHRGCILRIKSFNTAIRRYSQKSTVFLRDESAVSAIEFALVFPLFLAFILGLLAFCLLAFAQNAVESAAFELSRVASYYHYTPQEMTDYIRTYLHERSMGLIDPQTIKIELGEGVELMEAAKNTSGLGVYQVHLSAPWSLLTDFVGQTKGMHLGAYTLVIVEN